MVMKNSITILLTALYILTNTLVSGAVEQRKAVPLKQGVLLIATPKLEDPHFIHTVILVVSYGGEGAFGLIINRPSGIDLKKIFPYLDGIADSAFPVYLGGPVQQDSMSILFTTDTPPEGAKKISENLYFAYDKNILVPALQHSNQNNKIRIYAGSAGWAHGQLEHEIMSGAWLTIEANQDIIFTENPFKIWPSVFPIRTDDNLVQLDVRKLKK